MKNLKQFILMALAIPLVAIAADTVIRTDKLKLGLPSSSNDRRFIFDNNLGANNAEINSNKSLNNFQILTDAMKFGKTAAGDKVMTFDNNAGAANPKIKWNNTSGKLEFANDGTTFKGFGSGNGGGSGGINLITENADFETGANTSGSWVASSPATITTETVAPLFDTKSAIFTPTASSQTYKTQSYTIPEGLKGRPCLAMMPYKTAEATNKVKLQALDGSDVVLAENSLDSTNGIVQIGYTPFTCPTTGSVKFGLVSTGTAVALAFDNAHIGSDVRLVDVSQSKLIGTVKVTGCASTWTRSSSSFGALSTQTSCSYAVTGDLSAPSTMIAGFQYPNLGAGTYYVEYEGGLLCGASSNVCHFQFHDGTSASLEDSAMYSSSSATSITPNMRHTFKYPSGKSAGTIQIYGKHDSGSSVEVYGTNVTSGTFRMYYVPTSTETGVRVDQLGWHVDANISGANPAMSVADQASYIGIEDAGLTLTNNSGNAVIAAQIPCSSTNAPTGTTCAAGNESIGVNFNVPSSGDVLACASFAHGITYGVSGNINGAFQIVETANNAQTIIQEGKSRIGYGTALPSGNASTGTIRLCGNFTFSSSGNKTLRLMYEQDITNTISSNIIVADALAAVGQRDIHWEVYPLNYLSGALPIFKKTAPTVQKFLTGSGTYNRPLGVQYIKVKMVGGGGASQSAGASTSACGGGGGGYVESTIDNPLSSYSYAVGAGGSGGAGGNTTFSTNTANGGQLGGVGTTNGGDGGTATLSNGIGFATSGSGGGGCTSSGAAISQHGGNGGSSMLGGGAKGAAGNGACTAAVANSGGGGGGAGNSGGGGCNGGSGIIIVEEYYL